MARISGYDFYQVPEEVIDFKDEVTNLLNFGKYASQVLYNAASTPTWDGREGESVLAYVLGAGTFMAYTYFWLDSGWRFTTFNGTT